MTYNTTIHTIIQCRKMEYRGAAAPRNCRDNICLLREAEKSSFLSRQSTKAQRKNIFFRLKIAWNGFWKFFFSIFFALKEPFFREIFQETLILIFGHIKILNGYKKTKKIPYWSTPTPTPVSGHWQSTKMGEGVRGCPPKKKITFFLNIFF